MTTTSTTLSRSGRMPDNDALEKLRQAVRGHVLLKGEDGYDEARSIWNAMIDRKPSMIVQCLGVADVLHAVRFAREHDLLTSIRGGGHNIAGNAVCDDGLMIDLSHMRDVRVDPDTRRVHVGPGATLGDLDHETAAFGLATPTGINSTTGVAGLTLGGGFGWLSRKYGLTVDALRAVDVVTADGEMIHATEENHPDLFWALRGGGGNFGIVTRFEFEAFPVGPNVYSGLIVFSLDEAPAVLRKYREYVAGLPDETSVWGVLRQAPPLPFLPENVHGSNILVLPFCHVGDAGEGEKVAKTLRSFGSVLGEMVGVMPFKSWQQAFDPLLTPGARNYWKTHNFTELADGFLDLAVEYAAKMPSNQCEIFFGALGGVVNTKPTNATAYPYRDVNFVMNVHGRWDKPSEDEKGIAWSREFFRACDPYASAGAYINFLTADETDRVASAFGDNYEQLAKVKAKYDPDNFFRMNQNIPPKK